MTRASGKAEDLYAILAPLMRVVPDGCGQIIAIVGGGGKTATMFSLAVAARVRGLGVAVTTTTHIRDPRLETGRDFDHLVLLEEAGHGELQRIPAPGITVVAAGTLETEGRLRGINPGQVAALRRHFDLVLVEADGSKGLPVKAPGTHEPVMPPATDLVVGVVGLDCLGRPMDDATVHRPGLFGPLCGCAPGEAIKTSHIVVLCQAGNGLFKHCPPQAARVLLLNKADLLEPDAGSQLAGLYRELRALGGSLDGRLVCSLEPSFRLLHGSIMGKDGRVREGREG